MDNTPVQPKMKWMLYLLGGLLSVGLAGLASGCWGSSGPGSVVGLDLQHTYGQCLNNFFQSSHILREILYFGGMALSAVFLVLFIFQIKNLKQK